MLTFVLRTMAHHQEQLICILQKLTCTKVINLEHGNHIQKMQSQMRIRSLKQRKQK